MISTSHSNFRSIGYVLVFTFTIIYSLWNTAKLCYTGFFLLSDFPATDPAELDSRLIHYFRYSLVMFQFLLMLSVTLFALFIALVIYTVAWNPPPYNNDEEIARFEFIENEN